MQGLVELQFLGGTVLKQAGEPLPGPAGRRHPRALLALLVVAPANTLTRLKTIGLLWPDVSESTGRNRLTSILYQPACSTISISHGPAPRPGRPLPWHGRSRVIPRGPGRS